MAAGLTDKPMIMADLVAAILPIITARWLLSAGRFSPFGPFAMVKR
jgi:hypothetical protein